MKKIENESTGYVITHLAESLCDFLAKIDEVISHFFEVFVLIFLKACDKTN